MKIAFTRAMIKAALSGALDAAAFRTDPVFNVAVPVEVPNVPTAVLDPRNTWSDKAAYDVQARKLAAMFAENLKTFADQVSAEVRQAGTQPG